MLSNQLASIINAEFIGQNKAINIEYLLTDSRSLLFPEKSIFFALKTPSGNGHLYIDELIEKGVHVFVVSQDYEVDTQKLNIAEFFKVESPLKALQQLSAYKRQQSDARVIGITGSNGKTMVKEWLYALLKNHYSITRSPMSYNSQVGVPLSVWALNADTELGIFEAGISQPDEMNALEAIIKPQIGIFTHLGTAHQEGFTDIREKGLEKMKLFKDAEVLIYCADDATLADVVAQSEFKGECFTWSTKHNTTPLQIENVTINTTHAQITYIYGAKQGTLSLPFTDQASIHNALHCLAVCLYLNVPFTHEDFNELSALPMRLEVKTGVNNSIVINDSYSLDMNSLSIALDFMSRRCQTSVEAKQKVVILSDMKQTGVEQKQLYKEIAQLIATHQVDVLYGVGPHFTEHQACFKNLVIKTFNTTNELIESEALKNISNAVVLIKGARHATFEQISDRLTIKTHATTLEVDLSALAYNLRYYRSLLAPTTKMVCMIKASAYGLGDIEVARTLTDAGADYLAVAAVDEGVALRQAGINTPIIIMNPDASQLLRIFNYRLEPEVYSFKLLDALIQTAERLGLSNLNIHLKLDTGMTRLGFDPLTEINQLINILKTQSHLIPRSVFSHFVGSDAEIFDEFTQNQFNLFNQAANLIQSNFNHKILKHICNSAAIERFPDMHLDMVRLGLGLYGVSPLGSDKLANVASLKTIILQIHHASSNQTVGYSRRGVLHGASRIATLPIGYADGLNRHLGCGNGYVIINGQVAPYVGNICMDVCMVDVTNIPCEEGDVVEIFGNQLPISNIAQRLGTIPYEVLTSVSPRVHRVYFT